MITVGDSNRQPTVAAVFATMNRSATAVECIGRLAGMSITPDWIVVVDNASGDGSAEAIEKRAREGGLNLVLHRSDSNLGNAGGVEWALERAFSLGADWAWILDDDSWPEAGALEALLELRGDDYAVCSSLVMAEDAAGLSWPIEVREPGGRWSSVDSPDQLPDSARLEVRRSWLGCFLSQHVYNAIGKVRGELFLRGEDEDYPRRIEDSGHRVQLIPSSLLYHPSIGEISSLGVGSKRVMLERHLVGDKLYYRLRNSLAITKERSGSIMLVVHGVAYLALLFRSNAGLMSGIPTLVEAAKDAFCGRFGPRSRPNGSEAV